MTTQVKEFSSRKERELECLRLFLKGKTNRQIAELVGMATTSVHEMIKRNGWRAKREEMIQRVWSNTGLEIKDVGSRVLKLLKRAVSDLEDKADRAEKLNMEEIKELRQLLSVFVNEIRLEEGKPTSNINTSGTVHHTIGLPPTVKFFGVDPPGKATTLVTAEVISTKKAETDDEIEND